MIYSTSTAVSASSSVIVTDFPEGSYMVILLMLIAALLTVDLVRRLFIRR